VARTVAGPGAVSPHDMPAASAFFFTPPVADPRPAGRAPKPEVCKPRLERKDANRSNRALAVAIEDVRRLQAWITSRKLLDGCTCLVRRRCGLLGDFSYAKASRELFATRLVCG
jgi:hypothetical protein